MKSKVFKILYSSAILIFASACATRSYHYQSTDSWPIRERAVVQTDGGIRISASVPGEDETKAIFGIPTYTHGIQPVWLQIENNSPDRLRFAPTGLDSNYFSPLEVSYIHRKGFTMEARSEMDQRLYKSAMPRQIPAGETRSGYVFTNASPGTKSFNVDLFSNEATYSFTFFVTVPGFVPDHEEIDFHNLYLPEEVSDYDLTGFRDGLSALSFKTTDQSGLQPGLPIGSVIVGDGIDVLRALLRAGWSESSSVHDEDQLAKAHYLFGRKPDAVFRIKRNKKKDRNELLLWMAPLRVDGKSVWLAQLNHFIGKSTQLEQIIFGASFDPNIDDGRNYFLQSMWYSQNLDKSAWLAINEAVSIENKRSDFNESSYFTDGYVNVTWLSSAPVSLIEIETVDWDDPPLGQ